MRAVVIHGPGDLRVETRERPRPGAGELLVRTLVASICNATDVHIWEGRLGEELRPPFPHVLGHERAGEVVEVGPGVTGFRVGDRVACWAKMDGAFAEYDVVSPGRHPTVRVDDGVSDDGASLLEIVGATLRCLHSARIRPGERVLILGLGVQGIVLAQEARLLGAGLVAGVDLVPSRLDAARAVGVAAVCGLRGKSGAEALAELRERVGEVDVVIDASGKGSWPGGNSIDLGLELLRWAGRYVVYRLPTEHLEVNARLIGMKGIRFQGIDTPPHEVEPLLRLGSRWLADGRLRLDGLVTHRVPLDRVEEGLALCRDRPEDVLKVMVDP